MSSVCEVELASRLPPVGSVSEKATERGSESCSGQEGEVKASAKFGEHEGELENDAGRFLGTVSEDFGLASYLFKLDLMRDNSLRILLFSCFVLFLYVFAATIYVCVTAPRLNESHWKLVTTPRGVDVYIGTMPLTSTTKLLSVTAVNFVMVAVVSVVAFVLFTQRVLVRAVVILWRRYKKKAEISISKGKLRSLPQQLAIIVILAIFTCWGDSPGSVQYAFQVFAATEPLRKPLSLNDTITFYTESVNVFLNPQKARQFLAIYVVFIFWILRLKALDTQGVFYELHKSANAKAKEQSEQAVMQRWGANPSGQFLLGGTDDDEAQEGGYLPSNVKSSSVVEIVCKSFTRLVCCVLFLSSRPRKRLRIKEDEACCSWAECPCKSTCDPCSFVDDYIFCGARPPSSKLRIMIAAFDYWVFLVCAGWVSTYSTLEQNFDCIASSIPFVSWLTVSAVCAQKDPAGNMLCNQHAYPESFKRTLFVYLAISAVDIILAYVLFLRFTAAKRMVLKLPYNINRSNMLGFFFVTFCTAVAWAEIYFVTIIRFLAAPKEIYTARGYGIKDLETYQVYLDPNYYIGLPPTDAQYSNIIMLLAAELVVLAYVALPPDSHGPFGWFLSKSILDKITTKLCCRGNQNDPETMSDTSSDILIEEFLSYNPLSILYEEEFVEMLVPSAALPSKSRKMRKLVSSRGLSSCQIPSLSALQEEEEEEEGEERGHDDAFNQQKGGHSLDLEAQQIFYGQLAAAANTADQTDKKKARAQLANVLGSTGSNDVASRGTRAEYLQAQVHSRVMVFETEVLLYNLATAAYFMSTKAKPKTREAECALIESPQLQLVEHVVDEESDTHAIVVKGKDRVIVAFRGTVSAANIKTDLNTKMVLHPIANNMDLSGEEALTAFARTAAEKPPRVHRGFLEAYDSVKDRIWEYVLPLVFQNGPARQSHTLFVTGHSLGGGLAVMCAMDFANRVRETTLAHVGNHGNGTREIIAPSKPAVAVTTFGAPRICNFSFLVRFHQLIPTAHRFVCAKDAIPKTPPNHHIAPELGWQHVGICLLLDMAGNLLINPTNLEQNIIHGLRRPSKSRHFMTRYGLAMVLYFGRLRRSRPIGFWNSILKRIAFYTNKDMAGMPEELIKTTYVLFFRAGVRVLHHLPLEGYASFFNNAVLLYGNQHKSSASAHSDDIRTVSFNKDTKSGPLLGV